MRNNRLGALVGCRWLTGSSWLAGLGVLALAGEALATPGAHPALMSTSDTRASSVLLSYRQALGPLTGRVLSYNANFTSTGGILSAQFGAHVLQLQESTDANTLFGAAATGAAVWSVPLTQRYDNGVAKAALVMYAGGAPTAAVSGKRNFLNVPIGVGLGTSLSPASWVSFTPWFEAAPGVDLDTRIVEPDLSSFAPNDGDLQQLINGEEAVLLSNEDIQKVITDSIEVDVGFEMAMRVGLDITLRMSESWSFNLDSYMTTLGSSFGGQRFIYGGAGLMFHWDDIVPSVLPAARRLEKESCDDIERRFRMCPAGKAKASVSPVLSPAAASPDAGVNTSSPTSAPAPLPTPQPAVAPPSPSSTSPSPSVAPVVPAPAPPVQPAAAGNSDNSLPATRFPDPAPTPQPADAKQLPTTNPPY